MNQSFIYPNFVRPEAYDASVKSPVKKAKTKVIDNRVVIIVAVIIVILIIICVIFMFKNRDKPALPVAKKEQPEKASPNTKGGDIEEPQQAMPSEHEQLVTTVDDEELYKYVNPEEKEMTIDDDADKTSDTTNDK